MGQIFTYNNLKKIALFSIAQLTLAGIAAGQAPTFQLLGVFGGNNGSPEGLIEVSPGMFYGGTVDNGQSTTGSAVFSVSSAGGLKYITGLGNSMFLSFPVMQGIDSRFYQSAYQRNQQTGFPLVAIGLASRVSSYPFSNGIGATLTAQTPDGFLWGGAGGSASTPNAYIGKTDMQGNFTVVYTFTGAQGYPLPVLTIGGDGNFYGLAKLNSTVTVYRMTPAGVFTALGSFTAPNSSTTGASLVAASNGRLYGTNPVGGLAQAGTVFEVFLPSGQLKTIYEFPQRKYGVPTLFFQGSDGKLYGATSGELGTGLNGNSGVFSLDLNTNALISLYTMNLNTQGACACWMIQGSDGKLYGTALNLGPATFGSVWSLDVGLPRPLPYVRSFNPTTGPAGTKVLLAGASLLGATTISFNGTPTPVVGAQTAKYVFVNVPPGATSGPITIATPNGSFTTTLSFQVQ